MGSVVRTSQFQDSWSEGRTAAIDASRVAIRDERELDAVERGPGSPVSISVVLPAYNEAALIEHTVRQVAAVLGELADQFEIVVTDDGSVDDTGAILARLQQQERPLCLRVVTHERNRGYGAALASGFDAAGYDLIFMTDGDKQFDVAELACFLPVLSDDVDMVIGWRRNRADPPMRLLNAWGWKILVNCLFGYTARDVDCAFKLFRRSVWRSLSVNARGATFSAELMVKARRGGFRVRELPVSHFPRTRGAATGARPSVIARAFVELFQLWLSVRRERHLTLRAGADSQEARGGSTGRGGARRSQDSGDRSFPRDRVELIASAGSKSVES